MAHKARACLARAVASVVFDFANSILLAQSVESALCACVRASQGHLESTFEFRGRLAASARMAPGDRL